MKIVEINAVPTGSTGTIMRSISRVLEQNGGDFRVFFTPIYTQKNINKNYADKKCFCVGTHLENTIHAILGQLTGLNGLFSWFGTRQIIKECKKFKPDIIHIHVVHAFCFCLPMLFRYIKKHNIPVVWTFHDAWALTGHCPHFVMVKCDKWQSGCGNCPQLGCYPKSRVDNTAFALKLKKKWFMGVKNMTIVTPSQWLADLVKQSYLKDYDVKVINNGIDLDVFQPTKNTFRQIYSISNDKKIILGVASNWGKKKGLDVFIELAKRLDFAKYQIVLVGTDKAIDMHLPENIISIHRTNSQKELAEIYTAADLFVNPTREDTYPTVNMEAVACGTPVVTFNTGGSPEIVDGTCGVVVECDDIEGMEKEITRLCNEDCFENVSCFEKAKDFDKNKKFKEYLELYETIKSRNSRIDIQLF